MIIKITSHTIKNIWKFLLFIILTLILLISFLIYGIKIEDISLSTIKIDKLYIKLDKKLILKAKNIQFYRNSKSKTSKDEIYKLLNYIKYLNSFFKYISLKNIEYENEKVSLLYKDDIFYIDSKYLTLDSKLEFKNSEIKLKIKQLILKDEKLELKGIFKYNLKSRLYKYHGKFSFMNIEGIADIKIENDMVFYKLYTKKFDSLAPIMEYLKSRVFIEPLARAWIYKKIVGKEYKLENLEGKFNLKTGDFYPNFIKGRAVVKDALITFNPKVTGAHADIIVVKLENNTLSFELTKPTYEGKDIDIVDIHIYNLLTTKNGIVVNLKSDTLLDKYIHNILKSFGIKIPITQYSGTNDSSLKLDIKFKPFAIDAKGVFIIKNSKFKLEKIDMYSKYAKIVLDNDKVYLKDTNIRYENLFDMDTKGTFYLDKREYIGKVDINSLKIDIKDKNILDIKNLKNQTFKLYFGKKESVLSFKELKTILTFKKAEYIFDMRDISLYKKFSNFLKKYDIDNGKLYIITNDFKDYTAKLDLERLNLPIKDKDGREISSLRFTILANRKFLDAKTDDNKIEIRYDNKATVNLNNLDILIKDGNSTENNDSDMEINADNVNLIFTDKNITIPSEHFSLLLKQGDIDFISIYKDSSIGYEKNDEGFSLKATKLSDSFINSLLKKEIFKNGLFEISVEGADINNFKGTFQIINSTAKEFALFNNIIATINAIPSLLFFKDPEFNENGYVIKDGVLKYQRTGNMLFLNDITLRGYSADIYGSGYINLKNDDMKLSLRIKTLKDISSALKKVPLFGYIILGKDKSIYTDIEVDGKISKPTIKTNIVKDTILSPFNIIKRVIQSPLKLFDK